METVALEDLDEVDLLLTELEISRGKGNLILCTVASPAYRDHVIEAIARRFPVRVMAVESGDALISDLRSIKPNEKEVLIWTLPETLSKDILDALNNFRELFYDNGVPSLVLVTPSALDEVIWKAPDFWRYRGGYHILNGSERGLDYQAVEALSTPLDFSYESKEELLRRIRINEYLRDKISDQRELACILGELGTVYFLLGEPLKAIEHYEQALKISREIGDRRGEGAHLGNLGAAYADLGKPRKAIDYYQQALAIAREIGDRRGEGDSLGNLGNACANLGELRKAIGYQEQQLAISREIGDRRGEGNALWNMSLALNEIGNSVQAIECAKEALKILESIESPHAEKMRRKLQEWEEASNQIQ